MEISIKWNICRVCLREGRNDSIDGDSGVSQQMKHLFREDEKLVLHIYELSGVTMKPGDFLPDKICQKCVSIINNAIQFRKTCRSSNMYLKSVLDRTRSASSLFKPRKPKHTASDGNAGGDNTERKPSNDLESHVEGAKREENLKNLTEINNYNKITSNIENIVNLEHQESEDQQEHSDNIDYIVEMEEIIEVSEELEDQVFPQLTDDADVNFQNESNNYNDDDPLKSSKVDKDIENENLVSNDNEGFANAEDTMSHQDMEFDIIEGDVKIETDDMDESLIIHLEEKINDDENQAQVSSTVETNEEMKHYEHSSNISDAPSDIEENCLESENFNKISTGDSNETSLHTNKTVIKLEHTPAAGNRKSPGVFSRRKLKKNRLGNTVNQLCVCEICGNQYTNKNLMNIHMKVHYQSKNHQCELCSKRFITACNLQAHMRIHTGERPFECRYCHRRFNDRSSNIRHERTHTNEKPFECVNCGKTFTLATTLQNHMKVHTNERSYRCEPCGKSFKLAHHLKTHQNTSLHRYVLGMGTNES